MGEAHSQRLLGPLSAWNRGGPLRDSADRAGWSGPIGPSLDLDEADPRVPTEGVQRGRTGVRGVLDGLVEGEPQSVGLGTRRPRERDLIGPGASLIGLGRSESRDGGE